MEGSSKIRDGLARSTVRRRLAAVGGLLAVAAGTAACGSHASPPPAPLSIAWTGAPPIGMLLQIGGLRNTALYRVTAAGLEVVAASIDNFSANDEYILAETSSAQGGFAVGGVVRLTGPRATQALTGLAGGRNLLPALGSGSQFAYIAVRGNAATTFLELHVADLRASADRGLLSTTGGLEESWIGPHTLVVKEDVYAQKISRLLVVDSRTGSITAQQALSSYGYGVPVSSMSGEVADAEGPLTPSDDFAPPPHPGDKTVIRDPATLKATTELAGWWPICWGKGRYLVVFNGTDLASWDPSSRQPVVIGHVTGGTVYAGSWPTVSVLAGTR